MKRTREEAFHHAPETTLPLSSSMPSKMPSSSNSHPPEDVVVDSSAQHQVVVSDPQQQHQQVDEKERRELERRMRMERLRAENEAEELAALAARQPEVARQRREITPQELEGLDEEEQMRLYMGFGDFGTTKGKAVQDNHMTSARGAVAKNKARKYRQYMNRKGGFNRPLDKLP